MTKATIARIAGIANFACVIGAAVSYFIFRSLGFALLLLFGAAALIIISAPLGLLTAVIDERARKAIESGGSFCLYLRSFKIDASERKRVAEGALLAGIAALSPITAWFVHRFAGYGSLDLQRLVSKAAARLPVPAIGDKVTRFGIAKVRTSDDEWERVALRLMDGAHLIVFSPFPTPGAMKELDLIVDKYLAKTIFVMPPWRSVRRAEFSLAWEELRKAKEPRIMLPPLSKHGGVFRMAPIGTPDTVSYRATDVTKFSERNLTKEILKEDAWLFFLLKGVKRAVAVAVIAVIAYVGQFQQYNLRILEHVLADTVAPTLLKEAQVKALNPGDSFKECASCPDMMVVPAGEFMMGSTKDIVMPDFKRTIMYPQHQVVINAAFAVSKYPVTFDEWDECVAHGGCTWVPLASTGLPRDRRPVIFVSWDDVKQYLSWLSKKTGKSYRLLTEAEWEYAARAGSAADDPRPPLCGGCSEQLSGFSGDPFPVGSFKPNAFGLYDMLGGIGQWVEDADCEMDIGGSMDGSAVTTSNCDRIVRGWEQWRHVLLIRSPTTPATRAYFISFRVAMDLYP